MKGAQVLFGSCAAATYRRRPSTARNCAGLRQLRAAYNFQKCPLCAEYCYSYRRISPASCLRRIFYISTTVMATQAQSPEFPNTLPMALPIEMTVACFTSLSDISSVKALALASHTYLHTFLDVESHILDTVLRSQISPEVWSLADNRVKIITSAAMEQRSSIDDFGTSSH